MSPRPKVDHLRKPQIVAAAAEVIYERGLLDARIGDIAKRAGTSAPTILYYFESKDRLLRRGGGPERPRVLRALDRGPGAARARERQAGAPDRGDEPRARAGSATTRCGWNVGAGATRSHRAAQLLQAEPARAQADRRHRPRGPGERRIQPGRRSRGIRVGAERTDGRPRGAGDARTARRHARADGAALPGARI